MIDYKGKQLPVLTVRQIVSLADEVHADRRASMLAGAAEANLPGDEVRRLLDDLERTRGLAADVIRWAHTARGTMRIVEESLKLHGNGLKLDDLGLDATTDYALALRLLGFEPAVGEQDENPDPTAVPPRGGT